MECGGGAILFIMLKLEDNEYIGMETRYRPGKAVSPVGIVVHDLPIPHPRSCLLKSLLQITKDNIEFL